MPSNKTVSSDFKSFFVSDCELVLASTEEGGGVREIFMQSRVPLGPGKFHVVVLVHARAAEAMNEYREVANVAGSCP